MHSTDTQTKKDVIKDIDELIYSLYDISEKEVDYIKSLL